MKTLLLLAFILYHFPAQALTIDTVVCNDHEKRTTSVYHNVTVSAYVADLPFDAANDYLCQKLKQSKRNKRGN